MDLLLTASTAGGDMEREVRLEHLEWFQRRGISATTVKAMEIYTGRHQKIGNSFAVIQDMGGNVLCYPYLVGTEEVNTKYRTTGKNFYQRPNGKKTFWNVNVLSDPTVQDGTNPLVITEGENDGLALLECGYPYVVSVPDGAPPPSLDKLDVVPEPEHDTKYSYIFNNWEQLKSVRRIIIAADGDAPGRRLAEELVRRLGRVRCLFIEYPEGCKDFNEVLLKYGKEAVNETIRYARPYPISGVYQYSELPPEPDLVPLSTGWRGLDTLLRPFFPAFMVVTGTAGSGKSTWVNQLVAQMSILHGIRIAIASFEMRINPFVSEVLMNTFNENHGGTQQEREKWLEDNFVFIAPEPENDGEQNNVDWLLERATTAVIRNGIRILVIDPWNELDHDHIKFENQTDYISRAIRALKRFGRQFGLLIILVAHPSKSGAQKSPSDITLYDISDSAHFANKADFGVVIYPIAGTSPGYEQSKVMIKKVRYRPLTGNLGEVFMNYNTITRTFDSAS